MSTSSARPALAGREAVSAFFRVIEEAGVRGRSPTSATGRNDIEPALAAGWSRARRGPWVTCKPPAEAIRIRSLDELPQVSRERHRVGIADAHAFENACHSCSAAPIDTGAWRGSDGDVRACLTDAVLGAAGMEDIGSLFSSDDPALRAPTRSIAAQRGSGCAKRAGSSRTRTSCSSARSRGSGPAPRAMRPPGRSSGVDAERVAVRATTTDKRLHRSPRSRCAGRRCSTDNPHFTHAE